MPMNVDPMRLAGVIAGGVLVPLSYCAAPTELNQVRNGEKKWRNLGFKRHADEATNDLALSARAAAVVAVTYTVSVGPSGARLVETIKDGPRNDNVGDHGCTEPPD
jgi:hypothetical protein